jgi:hypothetical protein
MFTRLIALLLALLPAGALTVRAAAIELFASAHASLFENNSTNNLGGENYVTCGNIQNAWCGTLEDPIYCRNRALLKFPVAEAIPPGSRIKSATVVIWLLHAPLVDEGKDPTLDLHFHRMLVPWTQGAGINTNLGVVLGSEVQPGESCWDFRSFPTVPWSVPGGGAGTDFATDISGTIGGIGNDTVNDTFLVDPEEGRIVADLQLWLDNPHLNHGWMMKSGDESGEWTAKRFLVDEFYPRIGVEYVPPPVIQQLQITNGQVRFSFEADTEQTYTVQYRDSLTAGSWLTLTNVPAPPEEPLDILVIDPDAGGQTNRFYRVVAD